MFIVLLGWWCLDHVFYKVPTIAFACKVWCFAVSLLFVFFPHRDFSRISGKSEQKIFYRPSNNWYNSVSCFHERKFSWSILFLNMSQRSGIPWKSKWGIGERNEANDGNAGNQGGNLGNLVGMQGIMMGMMGMRGIGVGMQGIRVGTWGKRGGSVGN